MELKSLTLTNFRSFSKKKLIFTPETNLVIGPNAIGKTNVLESIYLLSTGKSFRASKEMEMIRTGHEIANLQAETMTKEKLEIILTTGKVGNKRTARKIYKINGVNKRWRDFAGILKTVLFRPEDINLILGSPSKRREYLDSVLEQLDWQYRGSNLAYKKGLRQRNKLLHKIREGQAKRSQLTFWNQLLIKNGQIVTNKREEMLDYFNNQLKETSLFYDRSPISQARLEKYDQAELALGQTLVGPHRDDLRFEMKTNKQNNKRNLALYGSRGEQRLAILNLKLAELEFIKTRTNQKPILLLDDIFSELDKKNRQLVFKIIDSCQVIIATCEEDFVTKKLKAKLAKVYLK